MSYEHSQRGSRERQEEDIVRSRWRQRVNTTHYHTFFDGGNFIVNGSLVGYNAFALSIKASPEPPVQAFFLIDSKFGKTVVVPVILDHDR